MYSQGKEEDALLSLFSQIPDGCVLDIGAWEGKTFSNSRALIEKGWRGVLVEPSPTSFVGLLKNYVDHDRVKLVNALVSAERHDIAEFWDSGGDALSTTERHNREVWSKKGVKFSPLYAMELPVARLFAPPFFEKYDFVNIDTEGTSTELFFRCLKLASERDSLPTAFCVEHDSHFKMIQDAGKTLGYLTRYLDPNNIILARVP